MSSNKSSKKSSTSSSSSSFSSSNVKGGGKVELSGRKIEEIIDLLDWIHVSKSNGEDKVLTNSDGNIGGGGGGEEEEEEGEGEEGEGKGERNGG